MAAPASSPSKEEWRSQFRAYRRSLSDAGYAARSALIVTRVLTLPAVARADTIHVYWPQHDRGEIDTRLLIGGLRTRSADIVLPVVTSFDAESPTLAHRRYGGPDALEANRWGIREPVGTESVPPEALDAVVVPALGAGRNGHRIGHGSGYYDAFLQSVSCPRIGLVYEECLVPTVPSDPHDVPLTTVVTEQTIYRTGD